MIKVIAKRELLDQVSSPKFIFLFLVSALLLVFSLYTGSAAYVSARDELHATDQLSRREIENRANYQELAQFGVKVGRAPSPLSAVAAGVSSALGRSARVTPGQQPDIAPPPLADQPVVAVLGELDLSVVIRVFLSLFVLLLTYDTIAGEKETGTLKAVLANPVPRTRLLLGKALGLFGTFFAATAIPAVLGLLVMQLGFHIELSGAEWMRLLCIGAVAGLYLLALFSMGLFVSTATTRSSVAFLVLLLLLVSFTEIIPKASPMLARQFRPVPAYAELQSERDRLQRENQQANFKAMSAAFSLMQAPVNSEAEANARQLKIDSIVSRARDSLSRDLREQQTRLDESYRNRQDAMTGLALAIARLSPAAAMSHAVEVMAGTDFDLHRRWRGELIGYRSALEDWFKAKGVEFGGGARFAIRINQTTSTRNGASQTLRIGGPSSDDAKLDLSTMPAFKPQAEPLSAAMSRAAPDMMILGLWSVAMLMLAFWKFLKYDVR
ncbi:MAG TPA: ABC transporter permease subunit [Gemmatimonadales bacterium]|nr:ABC transporter permease subunit [Gemmatimonadales bacterium]